MDTIDGIERLAKLKEAGHLSDAEYQQQKLRLLNLLQNVNGSQSFVCHNEKPESIDSNPALSFDEMLEAQDSNIKKKIHGISSAAIIAVLCGVIQIIYLSFFVEDVFGGRAFWDASSSGISYQEVRSIVDDTIMNKILAHIWFPLLCILSGIIGKLCSEKLKHGNFLCVLGIGGIVLQSINITYVLIDLGGLGSSILIVLSLVVICFTFIPYIRGGRALSQINKMMR